MTTAVLDRKTALEVVGSLSEPSKMPCYGFSISAELCDIGSELRKIPGSVCSKCYACKGRYTFNNVKNALRSRYEAMMNNPRFVEAMVFLLNNYEKSGFFRWFDSGDIQGEECLNKIVEICKQTPQIRHWLPTKEYSVVSNWIKKNGNLPANLNVRLSAYMLEGQPPTALAKRLNVTTSGVSKHGFTCPASNEAGKCGECRACWDKNVLNVSYKQH